MRSALRTALRTNNARTQVAIGKSIPAPVGGWDAQNPLAAMPIKNAVILDNWIPRPGYVEIRRGFQPLVAGFDHPVETLIVWRGDPGGVDQIFAASGDSIYTDLGSAVYASAINARWQYTQFANDAGSFAICVNGANTPQIYDGSAFADATITGTSGPITLDPTTLVDVMSHKSRLFFIEKNTLRVWFLDTNAIQGAAQLLDLGPVFSKGGTLACCGVWSLDGGQGIDDFAVWMTTEGQAVVYQGTDPSDANNWTRVGTYDLGLPLGRRALLKYGSDLALLTTDGIIPLSQALKLDRAQDNSVALTQLIQEAFAKATRSYSQNFGWQGILYQRGSLAIFNVPTSEDTSAVQYVQNLLTGAWCQFTGINAICWAIANDKPYFGGVEGIYEWDVGSNDNGQPLICDLETSFNYFGERGRQKKFTMLRPIIKASDGVNPAIEMLVDYKSGVPTAIPTVVSAPQAMWDEAIWDVSLWSDGQEIRYGWTNVTGLGYCGAVRMRVNLYAGVSLLGVGDADMDVLGVDHDTDLLISPLSDVEVTVQLIGFDLMYMPGGQL